MFKIFKSFNFSNEEKALRNKVIFISFICSILVIYIHSFNLKIYVINESALGFKKFVYVFENYILSLTDIAVPAFFLISAILFYRTFKIDKLLEKWKSRVFTILIPYLIWNTLVYLFLLFVQ